MPPKQKQRKEGKGEEDVFQMESEVEPKVEKIDLGDTPSLKRALDEAVIEAASEAGHTIDHTFTDVKILFGLLACGAACLAQFYPKKYPDNTLLLAGCVAVYVIFSALMTLIAVVCEKDAIAFTRAAAGGAPALAICSRLPRFQELYTLRIAPRGARWTAACSGSSGGSTCATLAKSVGAYFHEDGQLARDVIKKDAAELLRRAVEAKTK